MGPGATHVFARSVTYVSTTNSSAPWAAECNAFGVQEPRHSPATHPQPHPVARTLTVPPNLTEGGIGPPTCTPAETIPAKEGLTSGEAGETIWKIVLLSS